MITVEALMALLGTLAAKIGGKLGNRMRKFFDDWKQKQGDKCRNDGSVLGILSFRFHVERDS